MPASISAERCASRRRSASTPAWIPGWSVFTRPSRISGKPVTALTSVTGSPDSRNARAVPPVETSSKPRSTNPRPSSASPDLSLTDSRARRGVGNARSAAVTSTMVTRPSIGTAPARASATARGSSRCSIALIRPCSDASSSPGAIVTASWRTIGPPSSVASTTWTVQPVTFTPWASASRTAWLPGNDGSNDGWVLRMRPLNAASVAGPTMRMYPARTTRSTPAAASASASTASAFARSAVASVDAGGVPSPGSNAVSIPCSAAQASAGQSRSAKTRVTSPPSSRRRAAATSARRLLPAPDTPTATRPVMRRRGPSCPVARDWLSHRSGADLRHSGRRGRTPAGPRRRGSRRATRPAAGRRPPGQPRRSCPARR